MTDPSVGTLIRQTRLGAGLSQRRLARRLERRHSVVSRWEAGLLEPTMLDLARLTTLLGGTLDEYLAAAGPGRRWSSRSHGRAARARVGRGLLRARVASGVTFHELVQRSGIDGRRIAKLEAGADLSLLELARLLDVLGVRPQAFWLIHVLGLTRSAPARPRLVRRHQHASVDSTPRPARLDGKPRSGCRVAGTGSPGRGSPGRRQGRIRA